MNYSPSYHAAIAAMVRGASRAYTRPLIAQAIRDLRRTREKREVAREVYRLISISPGYFISNR